MNIKNFIEGLGEKKEELVKKATQCKNEEEMLALAKEYGVALDKDSAAELFASMQIKPGKLSDDELDSVAGGGDRDKHPPNSRPHPLPSNQAEVVCSKCGAATIGTDYLGAYYVYVCRYCHYAGRTEHM